MPSRNAMKSATKYLVPLVFGFACIAFAQQSSQRPAAEAKTAAASENHQAQLLFREEWKVRVPNTGEHPIAQADLANQNLELKLYGFKDGIYENQQGDLTFAWTGLCEANCALALRDKDNCVNLTGLAKMRWRTKQKGFHLLRPMVQLADGSWLVGDHADGYSADWRESEIIFADVRWRALDVSKVVEAASANQKVANFKGLDFTGWVDNPDLSRVDAVGFTDLAPGSGHGGGGSSRVQWIEVYGAPVPRSAPIQQSRQNPGKAN
jgi:hypothetical protein